MGVDLGVLSDDDVAALRVTGIPAGDASTTDLPAQMTLPPQYSHGWSGTPGVTGHREGTAFSTDFTVQRIERESLSTQPGAVRERLTIHSVDHAAELRLQVCVEMLTGGLLRMSSSITNDAAGTFTVGTLDAILPVPRQADEILDFTGRWIRERSP